MLASVVTEIVLRFDRRRVVAHRVDRQGAWLLRIRVEGGGRQGEGSPAPVGPRLGATAVHALAATVAPAIDVAPETAQPHARVAGGARGVEAGAAKPEAAAAGTEPRAELRPQRRAEHRHDA